MKIFITSGGTKVPIDPVRDITNMSHGTFGSKIAKEALNQGHEVFYFVSKDGRTPFKLEVNFFENFGISPHQFSDELEWCDEFRHLYHEAQFRNYDDYASGLESGLASFQPDIIILAAAVSDYLVTPCDTKVRSAEKLTIELFPAEKLIGKVKQWCPTANLVGFKLLVGSTDQKQLLNAAHESIEKNHCDLVVANEFNTLKAGNHEIMLVSSLLADPKIVKVNLAAEVVKEAVKGRKQCTTS